MKLHTTLFGSALIVAVAGGGAYGVNWWEVRQLVVTTDNAYVHSNVTAISSRVDGYLEDVHVRANQRVREGDPLVTIRADQFETQVDAARAELRAAEADVEIGRASVENARARRNLQDSMVAQAEAHLQAVQAQAEQAVREVDRYKRLLERSSGSRQKFEEVSTHEAIMRADVARAQAELRTARDEGPVIDSEIRRLQTEIQRLEAKVAQARSVLDTSEIALSDTVVVAPIDGNIGNLRVEPGMYMEAGWPMMSLVPLHRTWVVANFKETQLERLRVGQEVRIEIDAFPGTVITGRVQSLAPASAAQFSLLPSQNSTGNFVKVVQRVPVKITYDLPEVLTDRLVPGMSVVVSIDSRSAPLGAALADASAASN
jgi:membrane fusion protein (multidrug efflux system)